MTTKAEILKNIRRKCIDCCAGQVAEVRLCHLQTCNLWPYRLGTDPTPSKTGFAKNPSPTRGVLGGKSNLKAKSPTQKESPPEAATSDERCEENPYGPGEFLDEKFKA